MYELRVALVIAVCAAVAFHVVMAIMRTKAE
jgi:hypothetical protein